MSKSFLSATLLFIFIIIFSCKKDTPCVCDLYEECVDEECVLQENIYRMGDRYIIGIKQYVGVIENNSCIDTLVFNDNSKEPFNDFTLWANVPPARNIGGTIITRFSDTEFLLGAVAPICFDDGKAIQVDYRCTLAEDSVILNLYLLERGTSTYLDTVDVVLYR